MSAITWRAALLFAVALSACALRDAPPEPPSTGAPADAPPDSLAHADAAAFWRDFRDATLAGDFGRVAQLTRFPFATTGELDDDPVARHDRAAFPALYTRLLRQYERPAPGDSLTMRELIQRTPVLHARHHNGEDRHFRVGAFYFGRENGRWQLVEAYQSPD